MTHSIVSLFSDTCNCNLSSSKRGVRQAGGHRHEQQSLFMNSDGVDAVVGVQS